MPPGYDELRAEADELEEKLAQIDSASDGSQEPTPEYVELENRQQEVLLELQLMEVDYEFRGRVFLYERISARSGD